MGNLAPVAPKLDPLLRRLASDQDGERLACVAAIQRQLDRAGLSWHDLADGLLTVPEALAESEGGWVFDDYAEAVEWLLREDQGELSERDLEFCISMRGILRKWPPRPKQARWIEALVEKLGGRPDV